MGLHKKTRSSRSEARLQQIEEILKDLQIFKAKGDFEKRKVLNPKTLGYGKI